MVGNLKAKDYCGMTMCICVTMDGKLNAKDDFEMTICTKKWKNKK
jgi:hypothetical protein